MSQFVTELVLKSTILLLVPLGMSLLKRRTSADFRCKVNTVVLIAVALLPLAVVLGPDIVVWQTDPDSGWGRDLLSASLPEPLSTSSTAGAIALSAVTETGLGNLAYFAFAAYFLGAFLMLFRLILSYRKTNRAMRDLTEVKHDRLRREFEQLRLQMCPQRNIRLCWQESSASTVAGGVFRSTIGLPVDFTHWPHEKRKAALVHEIAHVIRNDCASILFARLVVAVYWWHPLSWMTMNYLKHDIERATDDQVLGYGIPAKRYAQYLVEVASRNSPSPGFGIAMANSSGTLRNRIGALIAIKQRRNTMKKSTQLVTLLVGFVGVCVVSSLQVAAASAPAKDREFIRLYSAAPVYPQDAVKTGVEGYVDLQFDINTNGATENIKVLNQVPNSGVFEHAAIEAMRTFRYLPKITAGKPSIAQGARTRLQFSLTVDGDGTTGKTGATDASDITVMSNTITRTSLDLKAHLNRAALEADQDGDGERFLDLAEESYIAQPEMAGYFLLRAAQLGTSRADKLSLLKAMTLYELGDLDRSLALFTQIAEDETDAHVASNWVGRIEYQIRRRELVNEELVSL